MKFVSIDNKSVLVQVVARHRIADKQLNNT